jgi:hypothetical protein
MGLETDEEFACVWLMKCWYAIPRFVLAVNCQFTVALHLERARQFLSYIYLFIFRLFVAKMNKLHTVFRMRAKRY